jgi:hypothetical protein
MLTQVYLPSALKKRLAGRLASNLSTDARRENIKKSGEIARKLHVSQIGSQIMTINFLVRATIEMVTFRLETSPKQGISSIGV